MATRAGGRVFGIFLLLVPVSTAMFPGSAFGLSVASVSVEEALERSALVIEGRVTAAKSKPVEGSHLIQTCVQVELSDVLKGRHAKPSLELCFLGGSVGSRTLQIAGMRYPTIGEAGIYLVEAPGRLQVHPIYGAEQGVFLLRKDPASGREHVFTSRGLPVTAVVPSRGRVSPGLSDGVARGVITAGSAAGERALAKEDFKASLRAILGQ